MILLNNYQNKWLGCGDLTHGTLKIIIISIIWSSRIREVSTAAIIYVNFGLCIEQKKKYKKNGKLDKKKKLIQTCLLYAQTYG